MVTRLKLKEVEYFLEKLLLSDLEKSTELFQFNLSAFLSAWRSVLDIMLYDFALHFFPSLTRDDKIMPEGFKIASKAQDHEEALRFINWWKKKFNSLNNNPLWRRRIMADHRGYQPIGIQVFVSTSSASYVMIAGGETVDIGIDRMWEVDIGSLLDECKNGLFILQAIVDEAEKVFGLGL